MVSGPCGDRSDGDEISTTSRRREASLVDNNLADGNEQAAKMGIQAFPRRRSCMCVPRYLPALVCVASRVCVCGVVCVCSLV